MVNTPDIKQTCLEELVEKYNHFIFDCDGVLFHSADEIGDAFAALRYIKQQGKKLGKEKEVYLFTNATTRTREELLYSKLHGEHKYFDIPIDNIYTASYLTAVYLRDVYIPKCIENEPDLFKDTQPGVFVIGEQGFKEELRQFGIRVSNFEVDDWNQDQSLRMDQVSQMDIDRTVKSVIVGTDFNLNFKKMAMAVQYINENGAELIGTNIDRNDGKDRLRPSGGSLAKLIEVAAGMGKYKNRGPKSISDTHSKRSSQSQPIIMGKPDPWCFQLMKKQHNLHNVDPSEFLMVGDNLSTDVLFGN